jgi:hypothetical protein
MDENEIALREIEKADFKARRLGVEEVDIIVAMFRHSAELAMTTLGPGKAGRFLKTVLNQYTKPFIIKSRRHWMAEICAGCGHASFARSYWVDCAVWERAWPGHKRPRKAGTLCISCLEARVGRPLKARDFKGLDGLGRWLDYRKLRSSQRRRPRPRPVS